MTHLRILDSITDRGDPRRPNEDASGGAANCAFVIDGATGLGDNIIDESESDAAWLAKFAAATFEEDALAGCAVAASVRKINERVSRIIGDLAGSTPVEPWNLPCAGFHMIRVEKSGIVSHGLGDCRLFLQDAAGATHALSAIEGAAAAENEEAKRAVAHAGGLSKFSSLSTEPEIRAELRRRRALYNTDGGSVWTLGANPKAAVHVVSHPLPATLPAYGLLCTDGFAALVDLYGRYDAASLIERARTDGLVPLLAELRAIEQREDPDGQTYPRFKVSDDATAVLFEIVEDRAVSGRRSTARPRA